MRYFEKRYDVERMNKASQIMAIAAAHHRLAFIHPFLDGNGRVVRLMSHAVCLKAGIGASELWSISRGLALGLNNSNDYKVMLNLADMPRQGDLDGRGNLSRKALVSLTNWFLRISIEQVTFMAALFDHAHLKETWEPMSDLKGLRQSQLLFSMLR